MTNKRKITKLLKNKLAFILGVTAVLVPMVILITHLEQFKNIKIFSPSTKGADPIAIWHFDEGYGTYARDSSSNKNDLTLSSSTAPTWNTEIDKYSRQSFSLNFDGKSGIASRANDSDFNFGTGSFTITGWFRHGSSINATNYIMSSYNTAGFKIYMNSSGYVCFDIDSDSTFGGSFYDTACSTATQGSYADSQWHHFAAAKNGTTSITLYIDGVQVAQDAAIAANGTLSNTATLYLGADSNGTGNRYMGWLDEVYVYNYLNDTNQIKSNYLGPEVATLQGAKPFTYSTNGLVSYWKMENIAGATAVMDSSGNGVRGSLYNGGSISSSGKFGSAGSFDGTNDLVEFGLDTTNFGLNAEQSLSISMWVYPTSDVADAHIIGNKNNATNESVGYVVDAWGSGAGNNICFYLADGTNIAAGCSPDNTYYPNIAQWNHLVFTFDGNTHQVKIYLNGVDTTEPLYAVTPSSFGAVTPAECMVMGGRNAFPTCAGVGNGDSFAGRIDDVRIYKRLLKSDDVKNLYNLAPGPVGYWKLDEGAGSTVADYSGNNYSGSLSLGYGKWIPGKFGSAVYFSGVVGGDDLSVSTNSTSLLNNIFDGGGTVEGWVYITGSGGYDTGTFTTKANGSNNGWRIYEDTTPGHLVFVQNFTGTDCTNAVTLPTNTWAHYAVTYSSDATANTPSVYINGVFQAATCTGTPSGTREDDSTGSYFVIGDFAGLNTFQGSIDDVRLYDYSRTPAQILEDMNAGHPVPGSPIGSPILHLKFDEGVADTARNTGSGGRLLDGSLGGATVCPQSGDSACPTWTNDGKFGKALNFDTSGTTDDYVQVTDNASIRPESGSWTVSAWAKPADTDQTGPILCKAQSSSPYEEYCLIICGALNCASSGQRLTFIYLENNATIWAEAMTTEDVADGNWHMYTAVQEPTSRSINLYVDGVLKNTTTSYTATWPTVNNTDNLLIGSAINSQFFNGPIDDVYIFSTALSDLQVKELYSQGKAINYGGSGTSTSGASDNSASRTYCPPGNTETGCAAAQSPAPKMHLTFDEKAGTTFYDISGNGNNGTLGGTTGATVFVPGMVGGAMYFNGTNNRVVVNAASTIDVTSSFTINAWVNPNFQRSGGTFTSIFTKDILGGNWFLEMDGMNPDTEVSGNVSNMYNNLAKDRWYFLSIVFDDTANTVTYYLNGQVDSITTGMTNAPSTINGSLFIGAYTTDGSSFSEYFKGMMDEVTFYQYTRSPAQIAWDYNQGLPFLYLKMDDCTGTVVHNTYRNSVWSMFDGSLTITDGGSTIKTTGTCGSGDTSQSWGAGATGKFGSAVAFDGTNDYVTVNGNYVTTYNPLAFTDRFSLSMWVKSNASGSSTNNGMSGENTPGQNNWTFDIVSGVPVFTYDGSGTPMTLTGTTNINSGGATWYNLTVTWDKSLDSGKATLYVNGKAEATALRSTSGPANWINMTVGAQSTVGSYFNGQVDEVRAYTYRLSPQQVSSLYSGGSAIRFGQ